MHQFTKLVSYDYKLTTKPKTKKTNKKINKRNIRM